jgi:hypothetical protein
MIKLKNLERSYPLAKEKFFYVLRDINLMVDEDRRYTRPKVGAVEAVLKRSTSNRACAS